MKTFIYCPFLKNDFLEYFDAGFARGYCRRRFLKVQTCSNHCFGLKYKRNNIFCNSLLKFPFKIKNNLFN